MSHGLAERGFRGLSPGLAERGFRGLSRGHHGEEAAVVRLEISTSDQRPERLSSSPLVVRWSRAV